jgi:hypothetical protein
MTKALGAPAVIEWSHDVAADSPGLTVAPKKGGGAAGIGRQHGHGFAALGDDQRLTALGDLLHQLEAPGLKL